MYYQLFNDDKKYIFSNINNLDTLNKHDIEQLNCNNNLFTTLPLSILKCKTLFNYKKYNYYTKINELNELLTYKIKYYYYLNIMKYYNNLYLL